MAGKTVNGKYYEYDPDTGMYFAEDGTTPDTEDDLRTASDTAQTDTGSGETKTVAGEIFRKDDANGKWVSLTSDKELSDEEIASLEAAEAQNQPDENQSQAETDKLDRQSKGESGLGNISPGSNVSGSIADWWNSMTANEKKMIGAGGGIGLLLLDKLLGGGLTSSTRTPSGYRGSIDLAARAQQMAVGNTNDPNRMAGSGGISYLTPLAVSAAPNVAGDRALIEAEAARLAGQNAQGVAKLAAGGPTQSNYLRGSTDGMADEVPATINGNQPARLAHGEFVIPADVVSHLGNGNSEAGAKQLYGMMDNVRKARTGTTAQGKEIDPHKFIAMATGGIAGLPREPVTRFATGGVAATGATGTTGITGAGGAEDAPLNSYFGPYINNMMTQANALAEAPYQRYQGPLTAGPSALQNQAFLGASAVNMPTNMGTSGFNPTSFTKQGVAQQYMNPYIQAALNPQLEEMRRQSDITQMQNNAKMVGAGAYGGSRQALMNTETQRNLLDKMGSAIGQGYSTAFDKAQSQFNTEQDRRNAAQQATNKYGMDVLNMRSDLGQQQRNITQQGLEADKAAFEEERVNPYKMLQFKQAMLSGMPVTNTQAGQYSPSLLTQLAGAGLGGLTLSQILAGSGG